MVMPQVNKSTQAEHDLMDLWYYIEERSGEDRADAVLRQINKTLATVAGQPGMGRSRNELREGLRSLPVLSYMIFYRPIENGIEVVRVLHGRRDFAALFREDSDPETNDIS
jgi:toxin ParE1/3/4